MKILFWILIGLITIGLLFSSSNEEPMSPVEVDALEIGVVLTDKDKVTYFAQLDENGEVITVIVADRAFINSGAVGDPSNWKKTYMDGKTRNNYAGKGDRYDPIEDSFVKKKPKGDHTLDKQKGRWIKADVFHEPTATST